MQAVVGSAAVSEVVFNAALKYLLIRLASGSRRHLEAIAPDMQRLRPLQKDGDPVFGVIVTTAAGGPRSGSAACCASCAIVHISRLAWSWRHPHTNHHTRQDSHSGNSRHF